MSNNNSQKKYKGKTAEQLRGYGCNPEKMAIEEVFCKGCSEIIDRSVIMDYLNGIYDKDEPIIVYWDDEAFHNEACLNYSVCIYSYPDIVEPAVNRKEWIRELDMKMRGLT